MNKDGLHNIDSLNSKLVYINKKPFHMKYSLLFTFFALITIFAASSCRPIDNSSKKLQTSTSIPQEYKNVSLNAIYSTLPQDKTSYMLMTVEQAINNVGLPTINRKSISLPTSDDPNIAKAYAGFRLAQAAFSENAINKKQYQNAADRIIEQADKHPNNITLQIQLAKFYHNNDKLYAAIRHGKNALNLDPNDLEAATALAQFYSENARYKEALQYANLALNSPQSNSGNETTAVASMFRSIALEKLGYIYAAGESHLYTWQLMNFHRRFNHYDDDIENLLSQTEFHLLIAARDFLQCGMVEKCCQTMDQIQFGPNSQQLTGYFTKMIIDLAISQRARINLLKIYYRYMLASGKYPEFLLSSFYNNCKQLGITSEYNAIIQHWYSLDTIKGKSPLISRYSYALALEFAGKHTMARLVLKNCTPTPQTASTWLDFARLDRSNASYNDMLDDYIRCIDAGPANTRAVLNEIENLIFLDPSARQAIIANKQLNKRNSNGALLTRAILAEYLGNNDNAARLYYTAAKNMPASMAAKKLLFRNLFRTAKFQDLLIQSSSIKDPEIMLYTAKAYQALHNYQKAEKAFLEILERDNTYEDAITSLASLYTLQKKLTKAENLLLKAARRFPQYDQLQLELIRLYALRSVKQDEKQTVVQTCIDRCHELADKWSMRYKDAPARQREAEKQLQKNLEEILRSYPDCKAARVIICDSYLRTNNLEKAVIHAGKLIHSAPDDIKLVTKTADIFQQADKFDLEFQARSIIWNNQPTPDSLIAAMKAARLAGLPSDSFSMLKKAISLFDNNTDLINKLHEEANFTFLILRNYDEAVELFQSWLNTCKSDSSTDSDTLRNDITAELSTFQTYNGQYALAAQNIHNLFLITPDYSLNPAFTLIRSLNIREHYSTSLDILNDLIAIIPQDNVFLYHEYAFTLIDSGQSQAAVDFIKNWQLQRPDATNRQYILMQTYQRADLWNDALELVRSQLRAQPEDTDLLTELVNILIHIGTQQSFNEAAGIMDQLENSNADLFKWFDYRIILDISLNQPLIAFEHLLQIGADPTSVATRSVKAKIYFLNGEPEKALDIYKQLVSEFPNDPDYLGQYSLVLENAGKIDLAIEQMEKILTLDSSNAMNRNNLAYTMICHNTDPQRAGRMIKEAIYQSPGNVAILDSVGWFYYKQGDFDTALEYIYHAAALDTIVDPEVMDHLGDCLYRLGHTQRAAKYWQKALNEIDHRIMMEKYLSSFRLRLKSKLDQYQQNDNVKTASLFTEPIN